MHRHGTVQVQVGMSSAGRVRCWRVGARASRRRKKERKKDYAPLGRGVWAGKQCRVLWASRKVYALNRVPLRRCRLRSFAEPAALGLSSVGSTHPACRSASCRSGCRWEKGGFNVPLCSDLLATAAWLACVETARPCISTKRKQHGHHDASCLFANWWDDRLLHRHKDQCA